MKVEVERRSSDYLAFLNGDRRLWGCGASPAEAIGNAVLAHYDTFGTVVVEGQTLPVTKPVA